MKPVKIGLLPLYIKLYDDFSAERHPGMQAYYDTIVSELEKRGLEVKTAPICRLLPEFAEAVASFEREEVDALVTLNLAYSPSLESASVLAKTKLPIIVLDTTRDEVFDTVSDPDLLMYNHGIHGVQDLCNLLTRNHKPYAIVAGFWGYGEVIDRAAALAKAAKAAGAFRTQRVGMVGDPFAGMGDFSITDAEYKALGVELVKLNLDTVPARMAKVGQAALDGEAALDANECDVQVDRALEDSVNRVCLAVRGWLREENLTAFTVSFLATNAETLPVMPFVEACRAMASGIGYAGEGDTLTAALVGSLLSVYPDTTFAEMFCPDWKHDTIFLSHMGEYNYRTAKPEKRLCREEFKYTTAGDTMVAYGTMKGGSATLCNLAPLGDGKFRLVLAPVEMLDVPVDNSQKDSVNGWFKPALPIKDFLAAYSRAAGTHHSALCYGVSVEELEWFARTLGFESVVIR